VCPPAERGLHDVGGGRLHHVAGRRGEEQQVQIERVEAGVGQDLAGGAHREVGRVLVVGRHPPALDAGGLREHPVRQRQVAGRGDPALQFVGGQLGRGEAGRHGGDADTQDRSHARHHAGCGRSRS
jgi:hypothetical protein